MTITTIIERVRESQPAASQPGDLVRRVEEYAGRDLADDLLARVREFSRPPTLVERVAEYLPTTGGQR